MGRSLLCRNHRLKQNNRIHSNKQGRAAVAFAKFDENVVFTNAIGVVGVGAPMLKSLS